eukprot:SAG31_NODE_2021_length_6647_cov_2.271839_5_plen_160_part_00
MHYTVTELFPHEGASHGVWAHGQQVTLTVMGSNCLVLELRKTSSPSVATAKLQQLPAIYQAMPISPSLPEPDNTGGGYETTFTIPAAVKNQLQRRAKKYPIQWTAKDSIATWLNPVRVSACFHRDMALSVHPLCFPCVFLCVCLSQWHGQKLGLSCQHL